MLVRSQKNLVSRVLEMWLVVTKRDNEAQHTRKGKGYELQNTAWLSRYIARRSARS